MYRAPLAPDIITNSKKFRTAGMEGMGVWTGSLILAKFGDWVGGKAVNNGFLAGIQTTRSGGRNRRRRNRTESAHILPSSRLTKSAKFNPIFYSFISSSSPPNVPARPSPLRIPDRRSSRRASSSCPHSPSVSESRRWRSCHLKRLLQVVFGFFFFWIFWTCFLR